MSATCAYRGIEAAVGPHRELAPGSAVAHPPHRFTQEVGSAAGGVGPVGVGPRRSGQLRPNRGQRGPWKHPEPAAQGPRGPNQGVYGLRRYPPFGARGLEGPLWASHGGVPGQRRGQLWIVRGDPAGGPFVGAL